MVYPIQRLIAIAMAITGACTTSWASEGPDVWNLESAARRVVDLAPERRTADAEVAARGADVIQARSWPNPTLELRVDDKLGQEDGRGGADITRLGLSQPLPLRRLSRMRTAAEAALHSAEAGRRAQQLQLERETARVFHALQLAAAHLNLAQNRLALAQQYMNHTTDKRDPLVRYLSPLERRRLVILDEEAQQSVLTAQREHEQALTEFCSLLTLAPNAAVTLAPLSALAAPPTLAELERGLDQHPAMIAAQKDVDTARAGIVVAESLRFADPELGLFRERDFINDARRDVTAIELSLQVPLWNMNRGLVDRATAEAMRAQANLSILQRDALSRLRHRYIVRTRLAEQAERMRVHLVDPARELLDLTRRAFATGESNILALVDANNTYFGAQSRYLEALRDDALAAADLRFAAGQSLITGETKP